MEEKKIKKFQKAIDETYRLMSLDNWDIDIEIGSDDEDLDKADMEDGLYGEVAAIPEYEKATVYFHPDIEDEDFLSTLRHELVHAIMWEFSELANSLVKTDTEQIALDRAEERAVHHLSMMKVFDE